MLKDCVAVVIVSSHIGHDYLSIVDRFAEVHFVFLGGRDISIDSTVTKCKNVFIHKCTESTLYSEINNIVMLTEFNTMLLMSDRIDTDNNFDKVVSALGDNIAVCPIVTDSYYNNIVYSAGYCFSMARPKFFMRGMNYSTALYDIFERTPCIPASICAVYSIPKIRKVNGFCSQFNVLYGDIDLVLRAWNSGEKTGYAAVNVRLRSDYKRILEINRKDLQTLISRHSINKINELNNSDIISGHRQTDYSSFYPAYGNRFGSIVMLIDGDPGVSYYRLINKCRFLNKIGWDVTITNIFNIKMLQKADVIIVQLVPLITSDVIKSCVNDKSLREKLIVDISDSFISGHPVIANDFTNTVDLLQKYKINVIAPPGVYNGEHLITPYVDICIDDMRFMRSNSDRLRIGVYGHDLQNINIDDLRVALSDNLVYNVIGTPTSAISERYNIVGYNESSDYPATARLDAISQNVDVMVCHLSGLWYDLTRVYEPLSIGIPVAVTGFGDYSKYDILNFVIPFERYEDIAAISIQDNISLLRDMAKDAVRHINEWDNIKYTGRRLHNWIYRKIIEKV